MAPRDRYPVDAIVNGTRGGVAHPPSPPSTVSSAVSSADTPEDTPILPPAQSLGDRSRTTDGASRGKKKSKQRQRAQLAPQRRSSFAQSAVLSPRPIQDLLVERAYLVGSLASQGARAADLIQRLSAAEQAAAPDDDPDDPDVVVAAAAGVGRRRLRKHAALLRGKIAAAAEQEKAVIVRLGELYVETQSRERWAMARARACAEMFQPVPAAGYFLLATGGGGGWPEPHGMSISAGLSPESPEFVPGWEWPRGANPWPMPDEPIPQDHTVRESTVV